MARRDDDRAAERETASPPARGSVKVVPAASRRQRRQVAERSTGGRPAAGADAPASGPRGDGRRKPAAQPSASGGRASQAPDHIRGPLAGPIQLGEFTVDGAQLMISWRGRSSLFTPAEWRLLCVLLRNPGTVLTREELAEHAWDVVDPDRRSTVDVYVSRIRRKLNPEGGRSDGRGGPQLIQTVRHRGYRLVTGEAAGEVSDESEDSAAG